MAIDYKKQGKKNRINGAKHELAVRKDLEGQGWIVDKWSNNVEFKEEYNRQDKEKILKHNPNSSKDAINTILEIHCKIESVGKLVPAKRKFNPFNKAMSLGTGFPDFIVFRKGHEDYHELEYEVIGVECKINGYLDKEEKEKCSWLLENNIFSKILIAKQIKEGRKNKIVYEEFNNA